ncbi:MAG TPA: energy coupling factor transporter S component ThiW [Candidatus Lachnoclostridium avicola]|nr:energy coupling factor transporter S component ThiW [Candidatus Lachnoclostridium avicola]
MRKTNSGTVNVRKLAAAGLMAAVAVACSPFSIPVGASRCFPVQHMVNVLAAVFLGPWYGVGMAFVTSLIRNMLGTGSLLAFPGSMCGALLCGLVYGKTGRLWLTYGAEIVGTGFVGGLTAWPVAVWIMGNKVAAFAYVLPFLVSTVGGTAIAAAVIAVLKKSGGFGVMREAVRGLEKR